MATIPVRNLSQFKSKLIKRNKFKNLFFPQIKKGKNKTKAVLYDISDDCTYNSKKNYTLNHLIERIKIYNEEKFNYEIITINLNT